MSARRRDRSQSSGAVPAGKPSGRGRRGRQRGGGDAASDGAPQSGGRSQAASPSRGGSGAKSSSGGRKRGPQSSRNRGGAKQGRVQDDAAFWGDAAALPFADRGVQITDDPSAVPRSLGPPPLPGHEVIAEHYFSVVYDRAVTTAGALAAAGGLIDPETLVDELAS